MTKVKGSFGGTLFGTLRTKDNLGKTSVILFNSCTFDPLSSSFLDDVFFHGFVFEFLEAD